jgi:Mycothiol maleylpyruvate isomerase N-terminal domain
VDRGRAGLSRADDDGPAARHAHRAGASRLRPGTRGRLLPADQRFSATTNADRIRSAQLGAAALPGAGARARDFAQARQQAWALLQAEPPGRVVQTRHGDRMLLTEFLRTRILELAVHGLDLAAALERQPWMTTPAANVTQDLIVSSAAATTLRAETGWDQVTLIAKLTGRHPVTTAETQLIQHTGIRWLALS